MSAYDESRYRMHQRFDEVLGSEVTAIVMEHLPPLGWHEIATKADLRATTADLRALESRIDARLEGLRAEFQRDLRLQGFALLGAIATVNAAAVALTQLLS
jgi:hypothetical protein